MGHIRNFYLRYFQNSSLQYVTSFSDSLVLDIPKDAKVKSFFDSKAMPKNAGARRFYTLIIIMAVLLCISKLSLFDYNHVLSKYFYWLPTRNASQIPPVWRRFSSVNCTKHHACHFTNLYWVNKTFHLYLGDDYNLQQLPLDFWNQTAYTGIGFGSPIIHLAMQNSTADNYTDLQKWSPELKHNANKSQTLKGDTLWNIPIWVHFTDPPPKLPQSVQYHYQSTTVFFSVMWDNLFRTLYAGISSWFTVASFGFSASSESIQMVLVDPQSPATFTPLLEKVVKHPLTRLEMHEDALFANAVVGISRQVLLPEIQVETIPQEHNLLRNSIFQRFCQTLKNNVLDKKDVEKVQKDTVQVTLILRDGKTRKIKNENSFIKALSEIPNVELTIQRFANVSIKEQLRVIHNTDILVAMHGAALTHTLFMRPNTVVLELFPWVFRKTIYQNLASVMNVYYQMWQNDDPEKTKFHWDLVAGNKFTNRTKEAIVKSPIDWKNMDSKNYWRNQDTVLDIQHIVELVTKAAAGLQSAGPMDKYLVFQPWGTSLGEQLDGFKSACAIAQILNRTVSLPYLAAYSDSKVYSNNDDEPGDLFKGYRMHWKPMQRYFALQQLPCRVALHDNFLGMLQNAKQFKEVFYFGHGAISWTSIEANVQHYFEQVLKMRVDVMERDSYLGFQALRRELVETRFGSLADTRVIALGPLFPFSNFDSIDGNITGNADSALKARVRRYKRDFANKKHSEHTPAFMNVGIYSQVASGLEPASYLQKLTENIMHHYSNTSGLTLALHLRRGNRQAKCEYATSKLLDQDISVTQATKELNSGQAGDENLFVQSLFQGQTSERISTVRLKGQSARTAKACLQPLQHVVEKLYSVLSAVTSEHNIFSIYVVTDSLGVLDPDRIQMEAVRDKILERLCASANLKKTEPKKQAVKNCSIKVKLFFLKDLVHIASDKSDAQSAKAISAANCGYGFEKIDSLELALIESLIAVKSDLFIGNIYSSFSHHIAEQRYLKKKSTLYF